MTFNYETIATRLADGVLTATLNNPPCNVMTQQMSVELADFVDALASYEDARVLVLESADPDFFIAHFDVELILTFPTDAPAQRETELNYFHTMCERLRTLPMPTIAKIAGRVGGGGNEFSSCCDMRFGLRGKTVINQMEVPMGILPGGCGTQQLPRLVGRGRAMEIILGADDLDAETAQHWGYLNRVFDTQAELETFVDQLSTRMAAWPREAVALAKQSILNAEGPLEEGLREEAYLFQRTLRTADAQRNMARALALGAQTREGEARIADLLLEVCGSD
jgi:enoyl-CoA hydratase/carnithine racemase